MNTTRQLQQLGQSLWLDNINRDILDNGMLTDYINNFSVTGLTSNPSIFEKAIGSSASYDADIRKKTEEGKLSEALFIELALDDLRRAADLFLPAFNASKGVDGWVSMEVSPLLANDAAGSIAAAKLIHAQAERPNLFVKIPGTPEGVIAIEESIFAGVPINVTLLFSAEQYVAVAEAYMRGIERRISAGLDPKIASVASLFVSRWDTAVADDIPAGLQNRLGIAIAQKTYQSYRTLLASDRWKALEQQGLHPQRLLWASTGTKDPKAPDTLYIDALMAPDTINTIPEKTLRAFADHGVIGAMLPEDGGDSAAMLAKFVQAGINIKALAEKLQRDGALSFVKSWQQLLQQIASKSQTLFHDGEDL